MVAVLTCAAPARVVVLEVAMPPRSIAIVWWTPETCARWSSAMPIAQPPSGARPATAMSPPRETSTPQPAAAAALAAARSAASAFPVAPRSSCVPGATQAVRRVGSNSIADGPGAARSAGSAWCDSVTDAKSRSYPSAETAAPTVGSTRPPVDSAACSAAASAAASSGLTGMVCPARPQRPISSESGRKRLYARSTAANSAATRAVAAESRWELVTATTAVVPSAWNCDRYVPDAVPITTRRRRPPGAPEWLSPPAGSWPVAGSWPQVVRRSAAGALCCSRPHQNERDGDDAAADRRRPSRPPSAGW